MALNNVNQVNKEYLNFVYLNITNICHSWNLFYVLVCMLR